MQITTYLEKSMESELSGNVIDLCPVGALTSKPYAFEARPWELKKTETIDVMDAVGSNVRIDTYGWEVKRVLPRLNNNINEEWISDKTRFACDGLLKQRLDKPYIRKSGNLVESSWDEAIELVSSKILQTNSKSIAGHVGDMSSLETINSFKNFLNSCGSINYDFREKFFYINNKNKSNYIFNTSISQIENSDFILLIGTNPRVEATILNARIRKTSLAKKIPIFSIGSPGDLTYDYKVIGNQTENIKKIIEGDSEIESILLKSKKPMVIIGESALSLKSGKFILEKIKEFLFKNNFINEEWNALNFLPKNASTVGAIDLNFFMTGNTFFQKLRNNEFDLLYMVGSDNLDFVKKNEFIIYQGSHGDKMAQIADVVLPSPAYTEQDGLFINLEGRLQQCVKATYPPGESKEDWKIFNLIKKKLNYDLKFTNFNQLREDTIKNIKNHSDYDLLPNTDTKQVKSDQSEFLNEDVDIDHIDYYFSNAIARSSKTMSDCKTARTNNLINKL